MNSALFMGQALLSIGEAMGVDVSDNELLREADACMGVPDHE
jgi:hypothetical protein